MDNLKTRLASTGLESMTSATRVQRWIKGAILYFRISQNTLCLSPSPPPKFCINHCFQMLRLGISSVPKLVSRVFTLRSTTGSPTQGIISVNASRWICQMLMLLEWIWNAFDDHDSVENNYWIILWTFVIRTFYSMRRLLVVYLINNKSFYKWINTDGFIINCLLCVTTECFVQHWNKVAPIFNIFLNS